MKIAKKKKKKKKEKNDLTTNLVGEDDLQRKKLGPEIYNKSKRRREKK
jgi:hypothetical protein